MSRVSVPLVLALSLVLLGSTRSRSQQSVGFAIGDLRLRELLVVLDDDDDDEDGVADAAQAMPPLDDTRRVHLVGNGDAVLRGHGARVLWAGRPLSLPATVRLPADVRVQGTGPEGRLELEANGTTARLDVHGVALSFEAAAGPIDPRTGALMPVMQVPGTQHEHPGRDRRFRVTVSGAPRGDRTGWLMAFDSTGRRSRVPVRLETHGDGMRSSWVELVTDEVDDEAPQTADRTLRVALRDRVEFEFAGLRQSLFVGRPGHESSPLAVRTIRARAHVMTIDGEPVIGRAGDTVEGATLGPELLVERQVEVASAVWAQCGIRIALEDTQVIAPRQGRLLSIGDPLGLPSAGSTARFSVGQQALEVPIARGLRPMDAAEIIAAVIRGTGREVRVFRIPRTENGVDDVADILLLLDPSNEELFTTPGVSDDVRQPIQVARVELGDGLEEFSNRNSMGGTLEERALVLPLRDLPNRALDVFFVDHFSARTRQGEAFIMGDGGALAGTVILDRRGASLARSAFTLAHELGHILLDQPYHPDDLGEESPRRLMHSDGQSATILGPKRLTPAECARARDRVERAPFGVPPSAP